MDDPVRVISTVQVGYLNSTFRPNNLFVKVVPLIRRKFHKTQQAILGGLQEAAEGRPRDARSVTRHRPR